MFKNPQANIRSSNEVIFSEFLESVEQGEVLKVEIQGNNINGVYANGKSFKTYSPNDPNLIEKLSERGCEYICSTYRGKDAFIIWCPTLMVSNVIINSCLDFLYETNARWKRWSDGLWKI